MPQTRSRFFDDLSKVMTDAAGLAEGARREVDTVLRGQLERLLAGMDIVSREEFEAAREMAARARAENEALRARVAALEAKLDSLSTQSERSTATLLIRFEDSVDDDRREVYARSRNPRVCLACAGNSDAAI